jgi:hypothetical protein
MRLASSRPSSRTIPERAVAWEEAAGPAELARIAVAADRLATTT